MTFPLSEWDEQIDDLRSSGWLFTGGEEGRPFAARRGKHFLFDDDLGKLVAIVSRKNESRASDAPLRSRNRRASGIAATTSSEDLTSLGESNGSSREAVEE
jgi:hypothetical protein